MRLSKVAWSILVGGIFIIAFVGLYLVYLREQRAQEPLNQSPESVAGCGTNYPA